VQTKNRKYYETLFRSYPDLVTISQLRKMLGGISESTARKLIRSDRIQHFIIRYTYFIPKTYIVDYVMSTDYAKYCKKLKVQI